MDDPQREQLGVLLEQALALQPERRRRFLEEACGDDAALLRELTSLLAAAESSADYFDEIAERVVLPALEAAADAPGSATDEGSGEGSRTASADRDAISPGDVVAHYEILERIGGGMGVVYKARDRKLGRTVALKFLPPVLAADPQARKRLYAEARAASALDHPNIGVVHEIGEAERGGLFIALAWYDGKTLKQQLAEGPLSIANAVVIARQIASALAAAHAAGIVHRDVKPANIICSAQGVARLVDFGIAKLAGMDLTREGATLGTIAYMSPEQTGDSAVDGRTDVWSLGVVLYEMLAGRRPFGAGSDATLIHAIRHDEPAPLASARPDAPPALAAIVQRCLAKDPAGRYARAEELLAELDALGEEAHTARKPALSDLRTALGAAGGGRPPHRTRARALAVGIIVLLGSLAGVFALTRDSGDPSGAVPEAATRLAVLPFHAVGPTAVQELAHGMVTLLTPALSDVGGIHTVPARTVLARVPGNGQAPLLPLDESLRVGRDVGAGSVLLGSITAFGENVRLTAEIRTVSGGDVLASADVTARQDSILDLTDRLALALLRELWRSRDPLPGVRIAALTTSSPAALRAYLRGEEHLHRVRPDSAVRWFRTAVETDSTFALAWLRLAEATGASPGGAPVELESRRRYAARALALADRLPERERSFARAENLWLNGFVEAFDSLAGYVARYSDDPIGWYRLGDLRYHTRYLGLFDYAQLIGPFLEATRLDATLGPGLSHVLDLARDHGDRPVFDAALERFARVAPPNLVERFRRQARIRWATPDSVVPAFLAAVRDLRPAGQRADIEAMIGALGRKTRLDPDVDPMAYPDALDSLRRIFPDVAYVQRLATEYRFLSLGAFGRAGAARQEIERWVALEPDYLSPLQPALRAAYIRVSESTRGHLPRSSVREDVRLLEQSASLMGPFLAVLEAYFAKEGDAERMRRYRAPIPVPRLLAPGARQVDTVALRADVDNWNTILLGDTIGGMRVIEERLTRTRFNFVDVNYTGPPWAELASVLMRFPQHRPWAIRVLRWQATVSASQTGQIYLWLGRALEAEGDRAGARDAYRHVLRLWTGADPYRQDGLDEARQALARLASDSG